MWEFINSTWECTINSAMFRSIDEFFLEYNYTVFLHYIFDNHIPTRFISSFDYLSLTFYRITNIITSVVINLHTMYAQIFFSLELLITSSTNFLVSKAITMSLKFLLCIALLIFARGGIPRYRFDYLTKLGWIRFLSLVLLSFLIELLLLSML